MKITNKLNLPEALVDAVRLDDYDNDGSYLTASSILTPPQIRILRKRHADEITEDVADRIWALLGKVGHGILEKAQSNDIREKRLSTILAGKKISGQMDNLCLRNGQLDDYKLTSVYAIQPPLKPEWAAQLNILAFLCMLHGYTVKKLGIVALLRDWSRARMLNNPEYPDLQVDRVDVPLWSMEKTEQFILDRIAVNVKADESGIIPECTDEERWATPQKFAVMKGKNKRATKLCNSFKEAEKYIGDQKNMRIEERPREYKRCADYCNVSMFCLQNELTK